MFTEIKNFWSHISVDSYLDGEGEEEEARREVQMVEVHQPLLTTGL